MPARYNQVEGNDDGHHSNRRPRRVDRETGRSQAEEKERPDEIGAGKEPPVVPALPWVVTR